MINTLRIRQVIKNRGVKLIFIADQLHCSEKTLYNHINKITTAPETFKQDLARVLGVSIKELK